MNMSTLQSLDITRRSATTSPLQRARGRRGGKAYRHLEMHWLQGLPGGLLRVERPTRRDRDQYRELSEPARPDRKHLDLNAVLRDRTRGRQARMADPQGRLHSLRRPRLPR